MSYQVLARKWRPKAFAEVVGQKHVLQALINALNNNRLHHAYLFSGTRGVGKTTLGRIFAKSLNCEQGISAEPCGVCTSCREIDEGRFVDLLEVDAASRTKVDETRELLDNVQYAPTRGRFKVYLIDEVHMLTSHSFNALLKTLEEPPPHVKFILATTDPQKLPVTILSRCLKFNLSAISHELISGHMAYVLEQEKVPADDSALRLIAKSALGSMRDALSLLDQAIAHGNGEVKDATVREMLGTINNQDVVGIIRGLIDADPAALMKQVGVLASQGVIFQSVLAELVSTLHLLALAQLVPAALDEEQSHLLEIAGQLSADEIQLYYQIALMGQNDLPLAPDPRAGFEMVVLRMFAFRPDEIDVAVTQKTSSIPVKTLSPAGRAGGNNEAGRSVAQSAQASSRKAGPTSEPNAQAVVTPQPAAKPVNQAWETTVNQLPLTGMARQLIANSQFLGKENGTISIKLDPVNSNLAGGAILERVQQALGQFYNEPLKLKIVEGELQESTPAEQQAKRKSDALDDAVRSMQSDPNIMAMEKTFGTQLDPKSVKLVNKSDN
ncbi:MAG: DNA polymerase III subunit gamma/tau [Gammaproteobacteria bacterium]|nr:DNA polymerase III subunit gamma/tau [Gammaproteobacteria bacterium]